MNTASPERGLLPVHGESVEVLILGSFPSRQSLGKKEYYGNPQNHFWRIIEALYTIDRHLPYAVRISQLTEHRIALWDILSGCCRDGSADARIREPVFNDLAAFLKEHPSYSPCCAQRKHCLPLLSPDDYIYAGTCSNFAINQPGKCAGLPS